MKQIAQNYKSGELTVVDAPVPRAAPGGLLVRTEYSLISSGTELMKVSEAKLSLLGKVRARPDQVKTVLETVAQQGPQAAFKKVMNRLDSYTPLGYSLCGRVVEVGDGVTGYQVGQRVACAGNQYALHAELNWVPVNLCAPVPDGVDPRHAAFTTVGAIAMQGVRQAELGLGETAVVIGLGLIGQLLVQLLNASGVRVVGVDISAERCRLAETQGAVCADSPEGPGLDRVVASLAELSGGFGADAVFLAAGGSTNGPVELAAELARDRGRVVDIGKCSLDLPWNAYYEKELDVRFSRSYGPGRYDPLYEEGGIDYPVGYVRWTEGRNLECFLDLLARDRIDLEPLISGVEPFDGAASTYERLNKGELRGIGFLFEYPADVAIVRTIERPPATSVATGARPVTASTVRIGFIGAGNYPATMLLPHLVKRTDVAMAAVATSSSLSCVSAQRKFGFERATTDPREVLDDPAHRCRLRRHPPLQPCPLRVRRRSGPARRSSSRSRSPSPTTSWPASSTSSGRPATTGCRWASTVASRRCSSSSAGGPVAGRSRPCSATSSTPGRCRRRAGTPRPTPRAPASPGRAGTSSTRWPGGSAPIRSRWPRRAPARTTTTSTSRSASATARPAWSATPRRAARSSPRRPSTWSPRARSPGSTTSAPPRCGAARRTRRQRAVNPDKGQAGEVAAFVDAVRSGGPMPIALRTLASVTQATLAVDQALASGEQVKLTY